MAFLRDTSTEEFTVSLKKLGVQKIRNKGDTTTWVRQKYNMGQKSWNKAIITKKIRQKYNIAENKN